MRESGDEIKDGVVQNGFDYELQVWVTDGIIAKCGHSIQTNYCNACKFHGKKLNEVPGHEMRP